MRRSVGRVIHFPPFRLDLGAGLLYRGDEVVALRPKTFATLCHLAERPGELVTKDDLLRAVWPDVVVTEDMPRFSVRELRRALGDDPAAPRFLQTVHGRGYRFLPPAPAALAAGGGAVVVGRDAELATLDGWLATARAGARVVGFVTGDPGIGKTTLVDTFLAGSGMARGALVARGECREAIGAAEPYRPLLEAIQGVAEDAGGDRVLALLRRHAPTWLAQLPSLQTADGEVQLPGRPPGATGERMVRELQRCVEAIGADALLVLVLEDLHWSDHATLDVLTALAHGRAPARLLVIATYRPVEAIVTGHPLHALKQELVRKRLAQELLPSTLGRDDVRAYLAARFAPAPPSPRLVAFVHDGSDGNPFFMTAVADQLVAEGVLVSGATGWAEAPDARLDRVGVPSTLREMVERQLDALDPATRAVVEVASVAGVEFAAPALAGALPDTGVERIEDTCDRLVREGRLLRFLGEVDWPDGTSGARYTFRHGLYRDVLYDRLPRARRQRLHQRVGERLEAAHAGATGPVAAELGAHFEQSRDRARAVEYLSQAADVAQRRFADREAIAYIGRALAVLDTMPPSTDRIQRELLLRLVLAPALGVIHGHDSPELAASNARVRTLVPSLGETPGHLFALLTLFTFELMRGRLDAARALADGALDLGPRVAPAFVTIGHIAAGTSRAYRGEFGAAREHLEAVLRGPWPETWPMTFDPPTVAASNLADRVLVYLGLPDQARARADETLARADALGHPYSQAVATSTIARMYLLLREPRPARALAEACLRVCAEHGFSDIVHRTSIVLAWAQAMQGESTPVERLCALRDGYARQAGMVAITSAYLSVAEVLVAAGRLDAARETVDAAGRLIEETGERMEEAEAHRWRGELLLASDPAGGWREARASFDRALAVARAQDARWLALRAATSLARLEADRAEPGDARGILEAVLDGLTEGLDLPDVRDARSLLARPT